MNSPGSIGGAMGAGLGMALGMNPFINPITALQYWRSAFPNEPMPSSIDPNAIVTGGGPPQGTVASNQGMQQGPQGPQGQPMPPNPSHQQFPNQPQMSGDVNTPPPQQYTGPPGMTGYPPTTQAEMEQQWTMAWQKAGPAEKAAIVDEWVNQYGPNTPMPPGMRQQ
jgi:hypothetical protein